MKKYIFSVVAAMMTACCLNSCEDVPMPYEWPSENPGTGDTDTPGGTDIEPAGEGTATSPYNVVKAIEVISALDADAQTEGEIYVKGKIVSINEVNTTDFGNATYYISDDGSTKNKLYIFRSYGLGNKKFTSEYIKVGDEVVICGIFTNYKGNTPETMTNKSYLISVNGKTSVDETVTPGDDEDKPSTPGVSAGITFDGDVVTLTNEGVEAGTEQKQIVINDLGLDDKASAEGTFDVADGVTMTVGKGDGKSAPVYYKASNGFRIYASNTISFTAAKKIANITMHCDTYNGTVYVGNNTATVAFGENTADYCNYLEGNSGGTQLRVKTITITYAK